jgi:hypothetical protein
MNPEFQHAASGWMMMAVAKKERCGLFGPTQQTQPCFRRMFKFGTLPLAN